MNSKDFIDLLKNRDIDFFAGVPCTFLKGLIGLLLKDREIVYVSATREEEALGIATGAYLCGKQPAVLLQNTGLGSSIGALASLVLLYQVPMLLLVSWRGCSGKDAPEHHIIGANTVGLLKSLGIPAFILSKRGEEKVVSRALSVIDERHIPVAILVREGFLDE